MRSVLLSIILTVLCFAQISWAKAKSCADLHRTSLYSRIELIETSPWEPQWQTPIVRVSHLFVSETLKPAEFYHKVYDNYRGIIPEATIANLHAADRNLSQKRTTLAIVEQVNINESTGNPSQQAPATVATMRFYEGTRNLAKPDVAAEKLPFEALNEERGLARLAIQEYLQAQRELGRKIFEVGKFTIEGSPAEKIREQTRDQLEYFWLKAFAEKNPEALFVGHVVTKAHVRLYERRYGFRVTETYSGPDGSLEYVMTTTGRELSARLRNLGQ